MKSPTKFSFQGLSISGEWDEANGMVFISEILGDIELVGSILGVAVNIRGSIDTAMDNCLRIKIRSIGKMPGFLIPGALSLIKRFNSRFAVAAEVEGDLLRIDPNKLLPDSSGIRILIQPQTLEISEQEIHSFRERLLAWTEKHGGELLKDVVDYILTIPDFVVLCANLIRDSRIPTVLKLKIALCIAYLVSPVDLLPEFLAGPLGFVDDAVAMGLMMSSLISEIPAEVIRENWRGRPDVLEFIIQGHVLMGLIKKLPEGVLQQLVSLFGKRTDEAAATNS